MAKKASRKRRAAPGSSRSRERKMPARSLPGAAQDQSMVDEARAAVKQEAPSLLVQAGRIVRKYSPLEKDRALLEVQTDQGVFEVLLGRDGSASVFRPKDK